MKTPTRFVAMLLVVLLVLSVVTMGIVTLRASEVAEITYDFANSKQGFAEGTITLTPSQGNYDTYYLYWSDDTGALPGVDTLGMLDITSGSGQIIMPEYTVIPPDATKVIAMKGQPAPTGTEDYKVEYASAVYSIPEEKRLSFSSSDVLYSFGAVSDPQLANDSYGSSSYPYDEVHLAAALETLAQRGVDFTISSGDTVNDQNGKQTYLAEYKRYQRLLADSSYTKPIYEANGNHDVGTVWNKTGGYYNEDGAYIMGTGLDSVAETINAAKPYFEITEPTTGDHFIFMALEGGFYTDRGEQFSTEQLDWLEGLLEKYSTDGKNIFIIEHANVQGWGSGDKLTTPYYYDLGLNPENNDVARFVSLMEQYKECVVITGHTHLELGAQYNYSDNNGTSAVIMHNSAIGGVRRLVNGSVDRTAVLGLSEGYIIEVYEDYILFNGINLYYNEVMPLCSYIIPFDTEALDTPDITEPSTTEATEPPTTEATEPPATQATEPSSDTTPTETNPVEELCYGDADLNGVVNVKDATTIQKYAADLTALEGKAFTQANVTGDKAVNVRDATAIQKFVAGLITVFPVQEQSEVASLGAGDTLEHIAEVLETYYTYSSYDQYMALKDYYYNSSMYPDTDPAVLEQELVDLVEAIGGTVGADSLEITVYFTNNYNWSTVKAYVWGSSGKKAEWSGEEMTYVKTNSMGEKIYSITFSYEDYQSIIFNNGSSQTVDISLTGENNVGYYISGESSGKYTCSTYTFA